MLTFLELVNETIVILWPIAFIMTKILDGVKVAALAAIMEYANSTNFLLQILGLLQWIHLEFKTIVILHLCWYEIIAI
jgi:hypothetical protein